MKKRALDRVYEELETKYKEMPDDKIQEAIDADIEKLQVEMENIQKQINGMEASEKGLDDETRENLEKEKNKKSQKINNLEGYRKNKTQISKIIDYKVSLETKLANVITIKNDSKKAFAEAKKNFIEASELLKDEKKTIEMDQNEYNDLLTKKENAEKEMKAQKETFEKAQAKVKELEAKIGKCNLAWRTLFANKTWDDIQLRAKQTKGRFTRRKDEEKIEEPVEIEDQEIKEQVGKNVRIIQEQQKEEKNLPTKVTTWTKIKNFFKSIPTKLKEKFGKEEVAEQTANPKATKQQKDEFLEALRQNVDVDYREAVRKAKEQKYINQHKAKSREEK